VSLAWDTPVSDTWLCSPPPTAGAGVMRPSLLPLRATPIVGVPMAAASAAPAAAGDTFFLLPPEGDAAAGALTVTTCLTAVRCGPG
jgi:hypothetical protein